MQFAFDFNPSTFWTSVGTNNKQYLTVCFNQIVVKLESFEITTSGYGCRPKNFDVDISTDGVNFSNNQHYIVEMKTNEVKKFDYKTDKYIKCFRYKITEKSTCDRTQHDIVQFEFFGYLKNQTSLECSPFYQNPIQVSYYIFMIVNIIL